MTMVDHTPLGELFDPKADVFITEHFRPHWSQAGAIVFVTFRTQDSIPREVLQRWECEKQDWAQRRLSLRESSEGKRDRDAAFAERKATMHWSQILPTLDVSDQNEFKRHFKRCREEFLDACHGRCLLKRPELAKIVADSLLHFDGERYRLGDFVVMPNHVHLLVAFATEDALKNQCDSWLHYTAWRINQEIGEKGKLWQQEPFDHLVRSSEQYDYLRQYIADNPKKANLRPGEFYYRRI